MSDHHPAAGGGDLGERAVSQPEPGGDLRALPGLIVMTPATVEDAYSMLLEAVAIDDPVIFCEHKYLYYHLKAEELPTEAMPVGKARIARAGRDMTIVTYSAMVQEALAVAEELADGRQRDRGGGPALGQAAGHRHGHGVGGADGAAAVRGRGLAVGRGHRGGGGAGGEEGFGLLDAPPQRLNAKDTPIPYHPNLWAAHRPTARSIGQAAREPVAAVRLCRRFPSSCPSWANPSPKPPSCACCQGRRRSAGRPGRDGSGDEQGDDERRPRPVPGRVQELLVELNESYPVGAVLGYLEATAEDAQRLGLDATGLGPDGTRSARAQADGAAATPAESARCSPPCAGCRCRPTPPGPATCRRA